MRSLSQTILIVDDDEESHFILQMALSKNEIVNPIVFLKDGIQLMDYLKEMVNKKWDFPAFILLDLNMPRMDGKEVIRRMKSHPNFCCIPIIVLSVTNSEKEIQECYRLGANCYIVKPDSFDQMVSVSERFYRFWLTTVTLPEMVAADIYDRQIAVDRLGVSTPNLNVL